MLSMIGFTMILFMSLFLIFYKKIPKNIIYYKKMLITTSAAFLLSIGDIILGNDIDGTNIPNYGVTLLYFVLGMIYWKTYLYLKDKK